MLAHVPLTPTELIPPLGKMPGKGPTPAEKAMSRSMPSQNSGIA